MNEKRIDWAIIFTSLWIVFWLALLMKGFDSVEGFGGLGAFLSGIFAPLALFWFYKSYIIQSTELRLQREELTLQREVLQQSVLAQEGSEASLKIQSEPPRDCRRPNFLREYDNENTTLHPRD